MLHHLRTLHYVNTYSSLENAADTDPHPPEIYLQTYGQLHSDGQFDYRQFNERVGLHWIERGECTFDFGDRSLAAGPGDLVVLYPQRVVRYYDSGKRRLRYHWMILKGTRVEEMLNAVGLSPEEPRIRAERLKMGPIIEDMNQWCQFDRLELATASALAWRLIQALSGTNPAEQPISLAERTRFIIDHHFASPLSMEGLAEQLQISRVSLYRHFQSAYGMAPKTYLMERRLEHAKLLLLWPERNIGEIALISGFNSEAYFSRLFRQRMGVPPSLWRQGAGAGGIV